MNSVMREKKERKKKKECKWDGTCDVRGGEKDEEKKKKKGKLCDVRG